MKRIIPIGEKRIIKKSFLCIFLLLILISCGKKRAIHITAIDVVTGQPYAGLEYTVRSSISKKDGGESRTEANGILDDKGEARLIIQAKPNRSYSVIVKQPINSCYNNSTVMHFNSPYDKDGHFTFEFAPCAYMRSKIANVNCEGATDLFNLRNRYTYEEWSIWFDVTGCYSNTGGPYIQVPAGKRYFQWKVTRPSGTTEHIDSIELLPGEYGELNIHY